MHISGLFVLSVLCTSIVICNDNPDCPDCFLYPGCELAGCPCKLCSGLEYYPPDQQPLIPDGCPNCTAICPPLFTGCPPIAQCTDTQISTYIPQCPDCVPLAGCQQIGCPCKDCDGFVYVPPSNPPQPPRPVGCPKCTTICFEALFACPPITQCTDAQLSTYVPQCTACDPIAGCQQIGCDCKDCHGHILTPPTNPPQLRLAPGCPKCVKHCPKSTLRCAAPARCTDEQLENYVMK